jgi:hypothetical protein
VYQGEDIAVVPTQQLAQVRATGGMAPVTFGLTHCSYGLECLSNLRRYDIVELPRLTAFTISLYMSGETTTRL